MSDLLEQARAIVAGGYTELRIGSGILDPEHWPGDGALVLDLPAVLAALERLERLSASVEGLVDALAECSEYFDTRADVDDGPDGQPIPNTAMRMQSLCESALNAARKAKP